MAWKEVQSDETSSNVAFKKFDAIGQVVIGRYVKVDRRMPPGYQREVNVYTFKNKDGLFEVTAPADLDKRLKAAALKPGYAARMTYVKDAPLSPEDQAKGRSAMKIFKLEVDDTPPAQQAPPPQPAPEDVPF